MASVSHIKIEIKQEPNTEEGQGVSTVSLHTKTESNSINNIKLEMEDQGNGSGQGNNDLQSDTAGSASGMINWMKTQIKHEPMEEGQGESGASGSGYVKVRMIILPIQRYQGAFKIIVVYCIFVGK